ncbi:hypothetical protein [Paucilactobacillus nenjiangensis]|uniref:hypothetical protein n=3 Tax=Paucilactobacillus nenjiangensis TaxID=1296540 RepID=UPI003BB56E63
MDFAFVLREADNLKIEILNILFDEPTHTMKDIELNQKLNTSSFKFNKVLNELHFDLQPSSINLEIESHVVSCTGLSKILIGELRLKYLDKSSNFRILQYSLLESETIPTQDFLDSSAISQPNYYHLRHLIDAQFERTALLSSVPSCIDNYEFVTRRELSSLYYGYYSDFQDPFDQLHSTVNQIINTITQGFSLNLSTIDQTKFRICIEIQLMRISNHKHIPNFNMDVAPEYREVEAQLSEIFARFAVDEAGNPIAEADSLLSCLNSQLSELPERHIFDFDAHTRKKNSVLRAYLQNLLGNPESSSTNPDLDEKINYILELNNWLLIYDLQYIEGVSDESYAALLAEYPSRAALAEVYTAKVISLYDLPLDKGAVNYLKYNYLLGFISIIPNSEILKTVNLAMDFSRNPAFSHYIHNLIASLPAINITAHVDDNTDIYLTDTFTTQVALKARLKIEPLLGT